MSSLESLYNDAISLLRELSTAKGIMASTIAADNYRRVWARDSVVCGIAGLLVEEASVIESFKNSLLTLARHQNESGMIPSNVLEEEGESDVSYGSLVGRLDSNTWFIVGSCLYYRNTHDQETWQKLKPAIKKCRKFLKAVEFNGKGWLYTPLSGNWADEYPIHGYTLYDNSLNLWGESLWNKIEGVDNVSLKELKAKTYQNFWPTNEIEAKNVYQKEHYQNLANIGVNHFGAFILPGIYDRRFDAAANAIANLIFNLTEKQKKDLTSFITNLQEEIGKTLIPAFWPVIDQGSKDWFLLEGNYSFDFKNQPNAFHNGGIWPVWMGLFCIGLAKQGLSNIAEKIVEDFLALTQNNDWNFNEYINSETLQLAGKEQMGYTASGIVFMYKALHFKGVNHNLGL